MKLVFLVFLLLPLAADAFRAPWSPISRRAFSEKECMICRFAINIVNYALQTQRGADDVYRLTNSFCTAALYETPLVCSKITKLFNQEVVKVLRYALITPDQICGLLSNNTCGHYRDLLNEEWEVNLNTSVHFSRQEEFEKEEKQITSTQPYRVIHLSDTHVDLKYAVGSAENCIEPLCCENTSTPIGGKSTKAGYWGSYSNCDVPIQTFESALKFINETLKANNDIDYIIWTGDIQPHDVWNQNKKAALATYDAVFSKVFHYLPNVRVFPTLGNHEMIPVDSFSPSNLLNIARDDSPEWLYRRMDSFWSKWLPPHTIQTFTKDGFYSAIVRPGLKLISLNTNFCHNKNFWLYINSTDPGNQLQWLINELQISELQNEKVHLIGHIPPGSSDCLKVWSRNFNQIVRRFSNTITGQFYGHTHNDEFEIFYDQDGSSKNPIDKPWKPISVGFVGPPVTTFVGVNPSLRIYTIDQNYVPADYEVYYMNLTEANIKGSSEEPKWLSSGSFAQQFGLNDTSPQSMHSLLLELVGELKKDEYYNLPEVMPLNRLIYETVLDHYNNKHSKVQSSNNSILFKLYRYANTFSDAASKIKFDQITADDKEEFLCKFFTSQAHDLDACVKFIGNTIVYNQNDLFA